MIVIKSQKDGFRRCGVAHSATKTEWPDGSFTDEQIETLQAEPMLIVTVVPDEGSAAGDDSGKEPGRKEKAKA